jgi:DegV family protein with EDD domain
MTIMKIALSAESTIDLPKELLERYAIKTVPFTLTMGEQTGLDGVVSADELFAYTEKTGKLPRTSAVNQFQFEEHFKTLLQDHDAVIHFSLSSELSSAYQNALNASLEDEFKGKVFVIDSRSLSTGIALLAIYASKLVAQGLKPEDIVSKVQARIPFDQASFSLESVNFLYKGGRCSYLAMIGANILRLKPEIYVKEGKMVPGKKYRGNMATVVMDYVEDTLAMFDHPDLEEVFITYSTVTDGLVEQITARLKKAGFKHIMATRAGGTISCHCGPHCLGILYINDGPHA